VYGDVYIGVGASVGTEVDAGDDIGTYIGVGTEVGTGDDIGV